MIAVTSWLVCEPLPRIMCCVFGQDLYSHSFSLRPGVLMSRIPFGGVGGGEEVEILLHATENRDKCMPA